MCTSHKNLNSEVGQSLSCCSQKAIPNVTQIENKVVTEIPE